MDSVEQVMKGLTSDRELFRCLVHGWACYGSPCPRCTSETAASISYQADFARRLQIERAISALSRRNANIIVAMDGEHRASHLGWVSSNTTVQMRALNSQCEIIERRYRGGRNIYRLTPIGLELRARLLSSGGEG